MISFRAFTGLLFSLLFHSITAMEIDQLILETHTPHAKATLTILAKDNANNSFTKMIQLPHKYIPCLQERGCYKLTNPVYKDDIYDLLNELATIIRHPVTLTIYPEYSLEVKNPKIEWYVITLTQAIKWDLQYKHILEQLDEY